MNTELTQKIVNLIKSNGPITVDQYFTLCLSDSEFGYYTTRDPFGAFGDFITAPEISQIFGEMLAIFLILSWEKHGFPRWVRLVEMGPGRGTMMADIIRAISCLSPDFFSVLSIHLMENSERLRLVQKQQLSYYIDKVNWCLNLSDVPSGFTFIVANEFFDSLPIKQFIVTRNGIRERMIDINHNEVLVFGEGDQEIEENSFMCSNCSPGAIFETSPCRDNEMVSVADRLSCDGGTAIIIDYGHFQSSMGDTLQAVKDHKYCSLLMNPGQADLTSHVDFQRLASLAVRNKLYINGCTTQRVFLEGLGIWQRMFCLMRKSGQEKIVLDSVRRLLGTVSDKKSMGELFKVLVVSHKRIDLVPFVN
ncbi:MAG: TetR family transcriptional regulator [Candidatus Liberibacter europaeus]|uniref:TetR family transcriptional regulator n=1 Tax=Candidatus Liberibacter europaeus TaxID=744859 RepID=A0A2T4VZ75_9HYPH|nr:TetR family transcriptional regulator [Candidatus Liberibacter europaeus]PTL87077.1 MAG: TetR family transcriptional regulator [Candidatus Liberibacter europaeus]